MADKGFSLLNLGDLTTPLTKLIETVSDGVGVLYEPKRIREKAKAEADASIIKAEADAEIRVINYRIDARIKHLESRRQKNIDSIVSKTADLLPEEVSDEKVDDDWVVQFINYSQDVSNEEMQLLWARLLAGEVARPGTYSLRALQLVRLLTPKDAEIFKRLCNYSWKVGRGLLTISYFYTPAEKADHNRIPFEEYLHLESLGLIPPSSATTLSIISKNAKLIEYCNRWFSVNNPTLKKVALMARPFSSVGAELASLCNPEPDEEYLREILDYWSKLGLKIEDVTEDLKAVNWSPE
jgi:hypothetical protein